VHVQRKGKAVDEEISLIIWDYGGQEVFHVLHHLFLTEKGIYVVVFDIREIIGRDKFKDKLSEKEFKMMDSVEGSIETVRFWLESIRLHAPKAEIALVGPTWTKFLMQKIMTRFRMFWKRVWTMPCLVSCATLTTILSNRQH